jgi:hypothetical protein
MKKAMTVLADTGRIARSAVPMRRENPAAATPRDLGNVTVTAAVVVILTWLVRDVARAPVPAEVTSAASVLVAYWVARKWMY